MTQMSRLFAASLTWGARPQDFWHTSQREGERVSDFVRQLELTFPLAYGQDGIQAETRCVLMEGPVVSGAVDYHGSSICIAAKNEKQWQEERRWQEELKKWWQYHKPSVPFHFNQKEEDSHHRPSDSNTTKTSSTTTTRDAIYNCDKLGHFSSDYPDICKLNISLTMILPISYRPHETTCMTYDLLLIYAITYIVCQFLSFGVGI